MKNDLNNVSNKRDYFFIRRRIKIIRVIFICSAADKAAYSTEIHPMITHTLFVRRSFILSFKSFFIFICIIIFHRIDMKVTSDSSLVSGQHYIASWFSAVDCLEHIYMEVSLPKFDCLEIVRNITRERKTCANWCEREKYRGTSRP